MSNVSVVGSVYCQLLSLDFESIPTANLPNTVVPVWTVLCVIQSLTAPMVFCINLLIIWSICEDSRLRSSGYNILIAILAFTDLLVGCVVQPTFISLLICLLVDCPVSCHIGMAYIVTTFICCGWSLLTLTIISLERYLAIEHSLSYSSVVTIQRIVWITAVSWVVFPAIAVVLRFQSNSSFIARQLPTFLMISAFCLIIIFCVVKIFRTTRRQRMTIAVQAATIVQMEEIDRVRARRRELKRYFTFGVILSVTAAFYLPSLITKIISFSMGKDFSPDFKYISQFIWASCIYFQSLANPVIVALRLSYVRKRVLQKLCCKKKSH